ncbi:MAG: glycosyltransferase [Bacteroides sp.]|nr:glycosyltransferase [Bacteroides sp.]MCM1413970.1 glycosyltransferase [Bacteroides sp.]MCM1471813.1 glycosyltransferase [Bacteroides sp.]
MTDQRPDISLIVVFHNAEATIERTLASLEAQTLKSVEYLFVDDGSTDLTVKVIESFLALHPDYAGRHRLLPLGMRRGVSYGTVEGIKNAKGRYVMRCDADDYLEPDALQNLLEAARATETDIVMAPMVVETDGKSKTLRFGRNEKSLNDFPIDTLHFSLCNKIIRTELILDNDLLPYEGIDLWEDLSVVSRAVVLARGMKAIDKPVYHYVRNTGEASLSRSNQRRVLDDRLHTAILLEQWFVDHHIDMKYEEFLNHMKFSAKVKMLRGPEKDVMAWKRCYPEINSRIMSLRHVPLRYRLLFWLVAHLPEGMAQWLVDLDPKT